MKKRLFALLAVVLAMFVMLSGCTAEGLRDLLKDIYTEFQQGTVTKFEDMQYSRPDPDAIVSMAEQCALQAQTETDVDALMETIYDLYTLYYNFITNYYLANIHYYADLTDLYWSEEYSYCMNCSTTITAAMEQTLYDLAACSLREELEKDDFFGQDFFDAYDGDSMWDETFVALMEQESALLDRYYEITANATEEDYYSDTYFTSYGYEIELLFLELVELRQQIADYAGYDSYPEFAYDFYFSRDYSPQQTMQYLQDIRTELSPMYTRLDYDVWDACYVACSETQVFNYVQQCASSVGGVAQSAFELLKAGQLYDISYSDNKYAASFEVFLFDYYVPYVFVSPTGSATDKLTFAHEFGHFCNDYAAGGSPVDVDVAEVFSQGMEYLCLCYGDDQQMLKKYKLADSLCVFVEQAAYAAFEHQVYDLKGQELTVENVRALYGRIQDEFGLAAYSPDERSYTLVHHFIIAPMYVISYVVSNDVAMQIYQAELTEAGSGVRLWEDQLTTTQTGLMGFVEEAGLISPFEAGRVVQIRKTLEEALK